jgi:PEGA domain
VAMKSLTRIHLLGFLVILFLCTSVVAAVQTPWQRGRIFEVRKSVDSKPLYWIANTPVTKDEVTYTIAVDVEDRLIVGVYTVDKSHNAPPDEWTRGRPIKLLIDGDHMWLKPVSGGDVELRIVKRKRVGSMRPITDAEMEEAYSPASASEPLIHSADVEPKQNESRGRDAVAPSPSTIATDSNAPAKPAGGPVGIIDVTTVPYLAEIYVDGASLGYSPAKFTLPAGKHVIRAQKDGYQTWSKDVTVLDSSEFTVYAELKKK